MIINTLRLVTLSFPYILICCHWSVFCIFLVIWCSIKVVYLVLLNAFLILSFCSPLSGHIRMTDNVVLNFCVEDESNSSSICPHKDRVHWIRMRHKSRILWKKGKKHVLLVSTYQRIWKRGFFFFQFSRHNNSRLIFFCQARASFKVICYLTSTKGRGRNAMTHYPQ